MIQKDEQIEQLFNSAVDEIRGLVEISALTINSGNIDKRVYLRIFEIVSKLKTVLNHIAADIYICVCEPQRVRYPVFPIVNSLEEFERKIKGDFPGLRNGSSASYDFLLSHQEFNEQERILRDFNTLRNINEHEMAQEVYIKNLVELMLEEKLEWHSYWTHGSITFNPLFANANDLYIKEIDDANWKLKSQPIIALLDRASLIIKNIIEDYYTTQVIIIR